MSWARLSVVGSLLAPALVSACFSPDAPPLGGVESSGGEPDTSTTVDAPADSTTGPAEGSTTASPTTSDASTGSESSSGDPPATCGDGTIQSGEACDDANPDAGDGCSDVCDTELGFACEGQPSTCTAMCGDGLVVADEECDDDNAIDGDGCTACTTDEGFMCTGRPSVCTTPCGNGALEGGEACDDGDVTAGDGCAADCSVELYYRCTGAGPGSCAPIRIAYIPADTDDVAFRTAIAAITGGPVDYFNAQVGAMVPTLMTLQASHDCVFTHPNSTYADSLGFGNTLAAFVDGGGNVVLGIATDYAPTTGLSNSTIMSDAYSPVTTAGNVSFEVASYAGDGTSPIHTGVAAYTMSLYDTGVVLQGGGIQDATFTNGAIAVAYRPDFKVVYLNGTGNASFTPTGDWPRLVANACGVGFL